jgi:hypothetical protein
MFKLFFAALNRLTAQINRSADLFEVANEELSKRLAVDEEPELVLPGIENGERRKSKVRV